MYVQDAELNQKVSFGCGFIIKGDAKMSNKHTYECKIIEAEQRTLDFGRLLWVMLGGKDYGRVKAK